MKRALESYYSRLSVHFGPTGWWPADSPFEIAVGAILVQNTAWKNVERALDGLKKSEKLDPHELVAMTPAELEPILRPAGFFRVKTKRLQHFCRFLVENFDGRMARLAEEPLDTLRPLLLSVHGIGPETADDILLYACEKPVFVVDTYTRRILVRHGLVEEGIDYEALRAIFESRLDADVSQFKEYHGLLVQAGHHFCKTRPQCTGCPLEPTLKAGQPAIA